MGDGIQRSHPDQESKIVGANSSTLPQIVKVDVGPVTNRVTVRPSDRQLLRCSS
jgi:hypothetical protein